MLLEFSKEVVNLIEIPPILQLIKYRLNPVQMRLILPTHHYYRVEDGIPLCTHCFLKEFVLLGIWEIQLLFEYVVSENENEFVDVSFLGGSLQKHLQREVVDEIVKLVVVSIVCL